MDPLNQNNMLFVFFCIESEKKNHGHLCILPAGKFLSIVYQILARTIQIAIPIIEILFFLYDKKRKTDEKWKENMKWKELCACIENTNKTYEFNVFHYSFLAVYAQ